MVLRTNLRRCWVQTGLGGETKSGTASEGIIVGRPSSACLRAEVLCHLRCTSHLPD